MIILKKLFTKLVKLTREDKFNSLLNYFLFVFVFTISLTLFLHCRSIVCNCDDDDNDDLNPGHLQELLSKLLTKLHPLVGLSS